MHPITYYDIKQLVKYNVKNNWQHLLKSVARTFNGQYHVSWVHGHQVLMRKGKTDILVFKKIFIDKEYNFSFPDAVHTIIDAGANIGFSAIYFANCFPKAKIIAIEPEASNYDLLLHNIRPYPNIYPVFGAISNKKGKSRLLNKDGDHWNFKYDHSDSITGDGEFYTIEDMMTMFNLDSIDFLKIDIEGGERLLFSENYQWLDKVNSLSIELHDFIEPKSSNTFFKAICDHQPFSFYNRGENHFIIFER